MNAGNLVGPVDPAAVATPATAQPPEARMHNH